MGLIKISSEALRMLDGIESMLHDFDADFIYNDLQTSSSDAGCN